MSNALAVVPHVHERQIALTATDIVRNVELIQQVKQAVMKKGVHYGRVPGMPKDAKDVLLKPGAELLLSTFQIAARPEIEDLSTEAKIRYRIRMHGTTIVSQHYVGTGVGSGTSAEEKYQWREAMGREEYDATPESRRRIKFKKKWDNKTNRPVGVIQVYQVKTNPDDLENSVLKIAKKRALVDLALTVTAASDMFDQDIDDLPEELRQHHEEDENQEEQARPLERAQRKSDAPTTQPAQQQKPSQPASPAPAATTGQPAQATAEKPTEQKHNTSGVVINPTDLQKLWMLIGKSKPDGLKETDFKDNVHRIIKGTWGFESTKDITYEKLPEVTKFFASAANEMSEIRKKQR